MAVVQLGMEFSTILLWFVLKLRRALVQLLRVREDGTSASTNPQFYIRTRYQEIYNLFKPRFSWWRLVLIIRKFSLIAVSLMFSTNPLFQAW